LGLPTALILKDIKARKLKYSLEHQHPNYHEGPQQEHLRILSIHHILLYHESSDDVRTRWAEK